MPRRKMQKRFAREFAKWGLRSANTPQVHDALSGVVFVLAGGRFIAYIRFSQEFVEAVGSKLPYGIGAAHPAYLKLVESPLGGVWRLYARYFDDSSGCLLVEYPERPKWVKRLREVETDDARTQG